MKPIKQLLTLFTLTMLAACQTNTDTTSKPAENKIIEVQPNFKSIINGSWVRRVYIDNLKKTKSPAKSENNVNSFVELYIDASKIKGDSLEIGAATFHEGGGFHIFLRAGIAPNSFPTNMIDYDNKSNFYELGYSISTKDTSMVIYHYDKNKKLIEQSEYQKAPLRTEEALQYMVNKTLVAGKYKMTDTTGKSRTIQLTNDGKIIGLPGFTTYYINTDFVEGPEDSLDFIFLNFRIKNQKWYTYEIKGDTINLYEVIKTKSEDEEISSLGQLKYKLIKHD
ncbi:hypothetical protein [Pedobacter sp. ok626]|uniref:hypothetical protein n=1 Tax=Pedobacter sp. ok626 TaxID=1761882 RepID=UPI000B8423C5|nr:hypothetical protein [Pedobacter sp. ok626]